MFTTDNGASPVVRFLIFLKDNGVTNLRKITIDVSNVELDAIKSVYPEVQVQWCLLHVARAWMGKIREHVKVGSSYANGLEQGHVMAHLKGMMWEPTANGFAIKLQQLIDTYGHYTDLMTYLRVYYLQGDAFTRWARAFQPAVYTNMETNNYIESWHNQLKTTYLRRKQNRRADRLKLG